MAHAPLAGGRSGGRALPASSAAWFSGCTAVSHSSVRRLSWAASLLTWFISASSSLTHSHTHVTALRRTDNDDASTVYFYATSTCWIRQTAPLNVLLLNEQADIFVTDPWYHYTRRYVHMSLRRAWTWLCGIALCYREICRTCHKCPKYLVLKWLKWPEITPLYARIFNILEKSQSARFAFKIHKPRREKCARSFSSNSLIYLSPCSEHRRLLT